MKIDLSNPVSAVPLVGEKVANSFKKLHIVSVGDLFEFIPRAILNLQDVEKISAIKTRIGERKIISAEVKSSHVVRSKFKHMWIVEALLSDETDSIKAIWFNQPYLRRVLQKGTRHVFAGEVMVDKNKKIYFNNPEIYRESGIFPIYPQTRNLSSRQISNILKRAVEVGYWPKDYLDSRLTEEYGLMPLDMAFQKLHFPTSETDFYKARQRYIFDSLIKMILANLYLKNKNSKFPAPKINIDKKLVKEFESMLPFELTTDQSRAVEEILDDLKKNSPMNRLVEGDVGSGKTVVALAATLLVARSGYRVAWIAPTQILARQHFETAKNFLKSFDVSVSLITSATKKLIADSCNLNANLLIGTHALLQKDIKLEKLGLVVVDEQHRFGVEQRSKLISNLKVKPHFLSLSATPIPRTLAHVIYGNLDLSTIFSKPADRLKVKTFLIPENKRSDSYEFIDRQIAKGQQAFVICPLIEQNNDYIIEDGEDKKAVIQEAERLKRTVLGKRKIAILHGKMKPNEKEEILKKMQNHEIDILVSTSVVEVGIDIKGATIMIIEDCEKFGLSQLHQFRGRIGRNNLESFCFCFTKNLENEKTRDRLKAFISIHDGFKLAEQDLNQRGSGAVFGESQSGFRGLNPLWFEDSKILKTASQIAKKIFPELEKNQELRQKVLDIISCDHLE